MEHLMTLSSFIIKFFGMPFFTIIIAILITNLLYMFLHFYFESKPCYKSKNKKGNLKKLIIKFKSKLYGINPEILERFDNKTAP